MKKKSFISILKERLRGLKGIFSKKGRKGPRLGKLRGLNKHKEVGN